MWLRSGCRLRPYRPATCIDKRVRPAYLPRFRAPPFWLARRAQVAELVDAPASGAGVPCGRGGSSPLLGTTPLLLVGRPALGDRGGEFNRAMTDKMPRLALCKV